MKILALEFSSRRRSVAVSEKGTFYYSACADESRPSMSALGLIEQVLTAHPELPERQLQREEIECLAIGLGPGSYAGIRTAIALAQGWQLARPVKLLGIGSVECLALAAQQQKLFGTVNFAIDAQRNEYYLARYEIGPGVRREIEPLKLASRDEVMARAKSGEMVAGPDADKWIVGGRVLFPDASVLGKLAEDRTDFVPGEKLEPIYLRETSFVKAPSPRVLPGV